MSLFKDFLIIALYYFAVTAMKLPENPYPITVSLGLLTLLLGCRGSNPDHEFFPLFADLQWQYRVERQTMDGNAELRHSISTVASSDRQLRTGAIRETLTGHRYYYEINEDGVFQVGEAAAAAEAVVYHERKRLVLPSGLAPSKNWLGITHTAVLESSQPPWEKPFRIRIPVQMRYNVESISGQIETPAGKFSRCLIVSGFGSGQANISSFTNAIEVSITTMEWFAPEVGLVLMRRWERSDTQSLSNGYLEMELDFLRSN